MFKLSDKSREKLKNVNPVLIDVVERAIEISEVDFIITEGVRTLERQKQLFDEKKSKTMKSYHLTGNAVDVAALVDGKVSWDWGLYEKIAKAFKQAAEEQKVKITWGGDWKTFKDGCHFQIEK